MYTPRSVQRADQRRTELLQRTAVRATRVVSAFGLALGTGLDLPALGYEAVKHVAGERAMHVFLRRRVA